MWSFDKDEIVAIAGRALVGANIQQIEFVSQDSTTIAMRNRVGVDIRVIDVGQGKAIVVLRDADGRSVESGTQPTLQDAFTAAGLKWINRFHKDD